MYGTGREQEGAEQIKIALAFLERHPDVFKHLRYQFNRLKCLTMLGKSDEIRDELIEFLNEDPVLSNSNGTLMFHIAWSSPDFEFGDMNTVEPRKSTCLSWQPHQAAYSQFLEDAFVQELTEIQSEDAALKFLRNLIERRDDLHPFSPTRAWTRVRLAKALLDRPSDRAEAQRLLQEAIEILRMNPFVPQDKLQKLEIMAESMKDQK